MDQSLRDELKAEVDDTFAGSIRHLPLKDGQKDAERPVSVFVAVLRTGDRDGEQLSFGRGNNARSKIMADGGYMRIDRTAYPDLVIRKNDKVVALDRSGEPIFEVQSVDDRSHLRLICELGDA